MRVLITGATGFVGQRLRSLLPRKFIIYGTSYPEEPPASETSIFFLDMRYERDVFDVVKFARPDWVFHLAALSNVRHSWEKRRETLETNLMGTLYLLEAAKKFVPGARILFISSSDVYGFGGRKWIPGDETQATVGGGSQAELEKLLSEEDTFHIVNPYAFSKAGSEILSDFYARVENVDIVIARPFPHTGPGQSSEFVCSDWARQIAAIEKGAALPVIKVGNLECIRDYTDVRDTVRAYVLLMEKGRKGEVYNICSSAGVSLQRILGLLLSFSKIQIRVETDESRLRRTDIPVLVGDNRKLCSETGWKPEIPLEQTLRDLLDYWRKKV